jgi:hypothetical protein
MKPFLVLAVAAGLLAAGEVKLGKPLALKQATPIAALLADPESYLDKMVQVKGKITAVCQEMGCWMALADAAGGKAIRVKVEDGVIVFPKDGAGKMAVAEGKFTRVSPASASKPATYQLAGQGAVIID